MGSSEEHLLHRSTSFSRSPRFSKLPSEGLAYIGHEGCVSVLPGLVFSQIGHVVPAKRQPSIQPVSYAGLGWVTFADLR